MNPEPPHSMRTRFIALVIALAGLSSSVPAADHTSTWNSTTGNWSDPTKWSTPTAPGTFPNNGAFTYDAVQSGGALTVDVPAGITLQKFSLGRGTLTVTNNLTLNELLTLSAPGSQTSGETLFTVLNGAGIVTAAGGLNWSAASGNGPGISEISGVNTALVNGRTQATDVIQVAGGMTMHGPGVKSLNRRAMNHGDGVNPSTVTWSEGRFSFSNNATFTNKPAAVFNNSFNGDLRNLTGTNYFINEGTFIKSGGTGSTQINAVFDNSGTVNVNTGSLVLASGGTQTGNFNVPSGTTLHLGGSHVLNPGFALNGEGRMRLFSGNTTANIPLTFTGSSLELAAGTFTATQNLTLYGQMTLSAPAPQPSSPIVTQTLNGAGIIQVSGPMTWSAVYNQPSNSTGISDIVGTNTAVVNGRTQATDVINITGGLTLNGGGIKSVNNRALNHGDGVNPSLASWTAGSLAISNAGVFTNKAGATFDTNFDGLVEHRGGTASTFINEGTFTKSGGAGITTVGDNVMFINRGTVNVNTGTLSLKSGGSAHSGVATIAAGSSLKFLGGSHAWNTGAAFAGAGSIWLGDPTLSANHATLTLNANVTLGNPLILSAPAPQVSSAEVTQNVNGLGTLRVSGPMTWSAVYNQPSNSTGISDIVGTNTAVINGRTQATDAINITGGLTINGGGIKSINKRALNHGDGVNPSLASWTAGNLAISNAGVFTNKAGATFDTNFDGFVEHRGGTASTFINEGTFSKSGGTSNTTYHFRILFMNSGTVDVRKGTLFVPGGYLQTGGELLLNGGGAAVDVNVTAFTIQGGAVRGSGTLQGPLAVGGGSVEPGINATETTSAVTGALTITGDLTLTESSRLAFDLGGTIPGSGHDRITEAGSAAMARNGLLILTFTGSFQNTVQASDVLSLVTSNQPTTGQFANVAGGRIHTADGRGSFAVTSGTSVVAITDFIASPTPARPLVLGQQTVGNLETPSERWNFTGGAGQQVRLKALNASAGGVAYTLTGPNGWTGFSYLAGDSSLVNLPFDGSYNLGVVSLNSQAGGSYAFMLEETAQTSLAIGSTFTGNLAGSRHAQLFRFTVTEAGSLALALRNAGLGNHVEMYLSRNSAPTRSNFEYQDSAGPGADRTLNVSTLTPGEWYVLVYADEVQTPGSFTLDVKLVTIALTSISPSSQAANQDGELTLYGAGFTRDTVVELVPASGPPITASSIRLNSLTQMTATFAAGSAARGTYDVRVRKTLGDEALLPAAFEVLSGGQPRLETKLIMPGNLGRQAMATIWVEYANTGDASMPAPLLAVVSGDVDGSDKPVLTLDQSRIVPNFFLGAKAYPPGTSSEAIFLGSGAQPGVLAPGERIRIPVYYLALLEPYDFSDTRVELQIRSWTTTDPTPIDWGQREESLRPPAIPSDAWSPVFAQLTAGIPTTGSYVQMLTDNARFLNSQGRRVVDVHELWAFEALQATGTLPSFTLASAVDSLVDAPGLALEITRRFPNGLHARRLDGPFGKGWFCYWMTHLIVEDADDTVAGADVVRVVGEGGASRIFTQDKRNGSYFPGPGDGAKLTHTGGVYELREVKGQIVRFRADGRIDYVEDTNGNRITASYNGAQRLAGLAHSSGAAITLDYNGSGLVSQVINSEGRSVTYTYRGIHLASTTTDDGKITSYTYATGPGVMEHALTSITSAGRMRVFDWDAGGRLASTALGAGQESLALSYDDAGGVTATDATGGISSSFFDHRGLLIKTVDEVGGISQAFHDHNLRLERLILPTGEQRSFEWYPNGKPRSNTDEFGRTTRMEFNHPLNRLTRLTDANGNAMRYSYDVKGNLLTTTYANNSVERWSAYTSAGLPQTRVNRRNESLNHTFTNDGRLDRRTFADGSFVDFDYDSRGNPVTMTEHPVLGADKVTTFTYAPATDGDRLRKVTYPDGRFVEYFFDADGRRTRMTDSGGGDTRYEYDAVSRLSKLRDAADNVLVEYLYDAAGRLARMNKGNGTATTYSHDAAGRLILLANRSADGSPHSSFAYTYDARGNRRTATTLDGTWTYTYDATRQLIRAVFVSINPAIANQDLRYNYDGLGNRISTVLNGVATNYVTNDLNQYTSIGGTGRLHDADGNLISDGVNSYVYNTLNQLVEVTGPGGVTQHEYSALGHRTATIVNGQRTDYLLDLTGMMNVLAEFGPSGLTARNVHGFGLVNRSADSFTGYCDYDGSGSVVALRESSGTVLNRYVFEPFGSALLRTEAMSNPFEFVGQFGVQTDADGGIFMRARHYQTGSGQFMQNDPIGLAGGDGNLRRYVGNNPVSRADPRGTKWWDLASDLYDTSQDFGDASQALGNYHAGRNLGEAFRDRNQAIEDFGSGRIDDSIASRLDGANQRIADAVPAFSDALDDLKGDVEPSIGPFGPEMPGLGTAAKLFALVGGLLEGGGLLQPDDDGEPGGTGEAELAGSKDPNEKLGPAGFGPEAWIAADSILPYRINFENIGPGSLDSNGEPFPTFATAPAQRVTITDQLQADFDWNSFEWSDFGFGDVIVPAGGGSSHFSGKTSMTFNGQTFDVEIDAGINFNTGLVTVAFQSINPEIGLPPDVLTGFLPPEDGTGRGKGHIAYTIRAKSTPPTGTAIRNIAGIRFDSNAVITTDQVNPQNSSLGTDPNKQALVTLDRTPPASSIAPLPASTVGTGISVTWSGSDVGSGVADYDIYVSENNGPWTLWLDNTSGTSARYSAVAGRSYSFFSVARDHAGLTETPSFTPDATTIPQAFTIMTVNTTQETPVSISEAEVLQLAASHLGIPVTLAGVATTSTSGAVIARNAGMIAYSPAPGFTGADTFIITVSDGNTLVDGTVVVNVAATPGSISPTNTPRLELLPGGTVRVSFSGISGKSYNLQRSSNLANWTIIGTATANGTGNISFDDTSPLQPRSFYRIGQ